MQRIVILTLLVGFLAAKSQAGAQELDSLRRVG